jgi:hypothetical protein
METTSFQFKCLEKHEVEECAKLISFVFARFDPFIFQLKISEKELLKIVIDDLNLILSDNLITICKDSEGKICGCYAGFKLSRLKTLEKDTKPSDTLKFPIDRKNLNFSSKLEILDKIDFNLLKTFYNEHKEKNELDTTIFCDYYCISDKYFQTSLAKDLALNFFNNCLERGIKQIYGSFFNIRAVKLLTKYFTAKIVKEIKVVFQEKGFPDDEYGVLLLGGDGKMIESLKGKPKF